ncbi:MAG: hypothetical protein IT178_07230, partial [Acidobacteria bacterium]|nr:hypothetical protein [Acidobacteriota bacterium]
MGIRSLIHQPASSPAEGKAVTFLKDTSRWRDNPLLAGEAVRALAIAAQQGHDAGDAVKTMTPTLTATANWNALKAAETDRPLMRVLFTAALAVLSEGDTSPSLALLDATKLIVADQQADGSWKTTKESIGWTTPAVTARARAALISSGRQPDDFAVAQTDRWSRTADVLTVADAAGVLLAMGVTSDVMADKQRALCLSFIRRGQQADGGWMPSADAPADAATTA